MALVLFLSEVVIMNGVLGAVLAWSVILLLTAVIGLFFQYIFFHEGRGWAFLFRWPVVWLLYFFAAHSIFEMAAARLCERSDE